MSSSIDRESIKICSPPQRYDVSREDHPSKTYCPNIYYKNRSYGEDVICMYAGADKPWVDMNREEIIKKIN